MRFQDEVEHFAVTEHLEVDHPGGAHPSQTERVTQRDGLGGQDQITGFELTRVADDVEAGLQLELFLKIPTTRWDLGETSEFVERGQAPQRVRDRHGRCEPG